MKVKLASAFEQTNMSPTRRPGLQPPSHVRDRRLRPLYRHPENVATGLYKIYDTRSSRFERLEEGYQLSSVVYFGRGTLPQERVKGHSLLGDLVTVGHDF